MPGLPPCFTRRKFQSALPLRGATTGPRSLGKTYAIFQSALPLRGATKHGDEAAAGHVISIRAPLAGSDCKAHRLYPKSIDFNPRSPCGERHPKLIRYLHIPAYFNPRSPCGERRRASRGAWRSPDFNPRSPCGERPNGERKARPCGNFNPRSPCGERRSPSRSGRRTADFNPRSPCGERPLYFVASLYYQQNIVVSKTVAANSSGKSRKTAAELATT